MITGCTNPKAANYNPTADTEDYSCIYLDKVAGTCYEFMDVTPDDIIDQSFTLSFSLNGNNWVFFHDYYPDFYFRTKDKLYNIKNSKIFEHHGGARGVYHDGVPKSFFIDLVFAGQEEVILDSVNWLTEVFNGNNEQEFSTLTHITIWNNQQCSGKVAIHDIFSSLQYEVRKTKAMWNFDSFRDLLGTYGTTFLQDIFHNFDIVPGTIDTAKPWYNQDLMHDNFFIIRLEFDNVSGNQIFLHEAGINAPQSNR